MLDQRNHSHVRAFAMPAQVKQSVGLLIALIVLLVVRNPIISVSIDLYRTLAVLCFMWIIVGPAVTVLRARRRSKNRLGSTGQVIGHLLAGIAMNVVAVFIIMLLLSGTIGMQGAGP